MTVGELKLLLEDYGDHIDVVAVDDELVSHPITGLTDTTNDDGMAACGLEFD